MDQLYFEEGYYDGNYFVYIAEAEISLTPYLVDDYLPLDYFLAGGVQFTLTGDIERIRYTDFASAFASEFTTSATVGAIRSTEATLACEFTQSQTVELYKAFDSQLEVSVSIDATANVDRRTSVTLENIANLNAQAGRILQGSVGVAANRTAKTISTYGDVEISTTQAKFGTGSALIADTGDYFTVSGDSTLYNGDFTVEMWAWASNLTQMPNGTIWDNRTSTSNGFYLYVSYGSIGLYEGINFKGLTSAGFNNSQWNHIAVVRNGTNIKVFVNGVQKISATVTTTNYSNRTTYIGSTYAGSVPFRAYIDEVRLSSSVRYTTGFTPATSAYANDNDTSALLHLDTEFIDDTGYVPGPTITAGITATVVKTTDLELDLAVEFTQAQTYDVYRDFSADLDLAFTQATSAVKITDLELDIEGAFSPAITANVSVDRGADLAVVSTMTATVGGIYPYHRNRLQGVIGGTASYGNIPTGSPLPTGFQVNDNNFISDSFTLAVWARRDDSQLSSTNTQAPIVSTPVITSAGGQPSQIFRLEYYNTTSIRVIGTLGLTYKTWTWSNAMPTDSDWHHYIIRKRSGTVNRFELFRDGISLGVVDHSPNSSPSSYDSYGIWTYGVDDPYGSGLKLGRTIYTTFEPSNPGRSLVFPGDLAQLWVGQIRTDYWNKKGTGYFYGAQDLGTTGTATGLPEFWDVADNDLQLIYASTQTSATPASEPLYIPDMLARFAIAGEAVSVLEVTIEAEVTATATATIGVRQLAEASLSTAVTVTAQVEKTTDVEITADVTATATVAYTRLRYFGSDLETTATVTTTAYRTQTAASDLSSEFTITAAIDDRVRDISIDLVAFDTVTATIDDRLRDQIALLAFTATVSANPYQILPLSSEMSVSVTAVIDAEKRIVAHSDLTATFTQTSTGYRVGVASAELQVQGFTITVGDVINFDPCLTLTVEPETRTHLILPESRIYVIDPETRTHLILAESRTLIVEPTTDKFTIGECQ